MWGVGRGLSYVFRLFSNILDAVVMGSGVEPEQGQNMDVCQAVATQGQWTGHKFFALEAAHVRVNRAVNHRPLWR